MTLHPQSPLERYLAEYGHEFATQAEERLISSQVRPPSNLSSPASGLAANSIESEAKDALRLSEALTAGDLEILSRCQTSAKTDLLIARSAITSPWDLIWGATSAISAADHVLAINLLGVASKLADHTVSRFATEVVLDTPPLLRRYAWAVLGRIGLPLKFDNMPEISRNDLSLVWQLVPKSERPRFEARFLAERSSPFDPTAGTIASLAMGDLPLQDIVRWKILVIFSQANNQDRIALGLEERVIRECFERSRYREYIDWTTRHAAGLDEIRRAVLEEKPNLLHYSGHGSRGVISVVGQAGQSERVSLEALDHYLKGRGLECVLLNSCRSATSQQTIGDAATIAMKKPIDDSDALEFSRGLYDGLGAGLEIKDAFDEGRKTVLLKNPSSDIDATLTLPAGPKS